MIVMYYYRPGETIMLTDIRSLSQSFLREISLKFMRYFFSSCTNPPRMLFIIGPRGVGKTTCLLQYLIKYSRQNPLSEKILYVPADHILVEKVGLYEIANNFLQEGGELLAIDEIHKYPNWSKELKSIFDTFKRLQIVVSGSSSMEISKGISDLSRRALVFNMKHMSFREFIEFEHGVVIPPVSLEEILKNHQDISNLTLKKIESEGHKILPLFQKYLKTGLFPFYKEYNNIENYYLALNQMINSSVENDIISVYPKLSGTSLKRIKQLLIYVTKSCPFTPDMKKIKTALSITDERTLKQYLTFLDKLQLIINVEKAGGKFAGLQKPEKIYLNNTNFMYALVSSENINKGNLRETYVANLLHGIRSLQVPLSGDFLVDETYTFEIGGKTKGEKQIKNTKHSYILSDDIEYGIKNKIPLWLIGFSY